MTSNEEHPFPLLQANFISVRAQLMLSSRPSAKASLHHHSFSQLEILASKVSSLYRQYTDLLFSLDDTVNSNELEEYFDEYMDVTNHYTEYSEVIIQLRLDAGHGYLSSTEMHQTESSIVSPPSSPVEDAMPPNLSYSAELALSPKQPISSDETSLAQPPEPPDSSADIYLVSLPELPKSSNVDILALPPMLTDSCKETVLASPQTLPESCNVALLTLLPDSSKDTFLYRPHYIY